MKFQVTATVIPNETDSWPGKTLFFEFASAEFVQAQNLFQLLCQRESVQDVSLDAISEGGNIILIGNKQEMIALYEKMRQKAATGDIGNVPIQ